MGNICCCLIQPYKDYLVSVDTKERWHYKVLPLSLPDLQNPVRLNGYQGDNFFPLAGGMFPAFDNQGSFS